MLQSLKRLNVDTVDMEEALSLRAFAKSLVSEYESALIPVPEWLADAVRRLNAEIANRRRDVLELRLKEIKREQSGLMTAAEKREKLAAEQTALEAQLQSA